MTRDDKRLSDLQSGMEGPLDAGGHPTKDEHVVGPILPGAGEVAARPARTLWGDALTRLRRNRLAVIGLVWVTIVIAVALSADLWVPQFFAEPTSTEFGSLESPSAQHPFGTDRIGRDVFSRVIYGARPSLSVGVLAVSISLVLGLILGALSGYYGGVLDAFVMRTADVFFAFPYMLFTIALLAVLGPGLQNVFIAIGILGWPSIARVFRSSILSVKENEYVDAARAMGATDLRIMFRHIMPNAIAPIIVYGTMSIGGAIITEAALSYLGMGVQAPTPSWGSMLSEAKALMIPAPWLTIWPGFAILTTVLSFVLMGDGMRDALDVKMKD
jgi:peptide/nickel transport system permease protein/oligopeptide transport system permease protein